MAGSFSKRKTFSLGLNAGLLQSLLFTTSSTSLMTMNNIQFSILQLFQLGLWLWWSCTTLTVL